MSAQLSPTSEAATLRRFEVTHELVLAAVLAFEIAVFSAIGTNFWSWANAFEITRLLVEVGLLAVAMTPVIVTGGIDLSVGSLMGLSAVLFGELYRDQGWPIPAAAAATLLMGTAAGGLNALLITRLRLPPLIVTLGTFSLFRGLGEGFTRGFENYSQFPDSFLFLGQGYLMAGVPTQLPIFVLAAIGYWVLLQRSTIGRGLYAIGFSPEGARHAGIPVERRLALVYILSGLTASLAAIIYVAHLGQAKSDAGTGYELDAITAVVLGGTSIFGGRGTIQGTVLGLLAITVLRNGLQLADQSGYLAGILVGGLLLVTISMERLSTRARRPALPARFEGEEFEVKNSQVAVLSVVILLGAIIIAASNWMLVRNLRDSGELGATTSEGAATTSGTAPAAKKKIVVGVMPKSLGNAYFINLHKGAQEAAKELGIELLYNGPTDPDPAKQSQIVDTWITRGVDVIAVAVENRDAISSVLKKARQRGIKVLTYDADANPEAREFFINQATPQGIGYTLMDHAARIMGGEGEFAIITASLTAANMIEWQKHIEQRRSTKYPDIKMVDLRPCDDMQGKALNEANTILNAYPDVKLIMAICSPAVPGAAEAVKQSGRTDVKVIGLGLPNENKEYVHQGITESVVLWNTMDLGYLTIYAADALYKGTLKPGDKSLKAGRLGSMEVQGDNVLLGEPFTFNKENIDQFDF
jgi:ribose/xylose/arabinose/galactoside ABC-type transport system permease subunit/ABC-type sugar transport system substrate-binding protein